MIEKQNQINQFNNKDCKNLIIVASVTVLAAIITIILSCSIHKSNLRLRNFHNNNQRIDTSKLGLSMEELEKRTDPKYLSTIHLLKTNAPEYNSLAQGDKDALKHLVKAAMYLENIEYQIDDQYNLPFKKYLEDEIKKNNTQAKLTKLRATWQDLYKSVDKSRKKVTDASSLLKNYELMVDNKLKTLESVDIKKLEAKVRARGLPWKKLI